MGFTYNVQVVNRVLDLLECLAQQEKGMRLTDLSSALDLPSSTTHRLVRLMARRGYVEQDAETKRYFMGLKVLELRGQVLARRHLVDQATPLMEELKNQVGELVHLGVLFEGEVVYIRSLEGPRVSGMHTPVGSRSPIHCTSLGKAMLAYLPEEEAEAIIEEKGLARLTPRTLTTPAELQANLAAVRARGFAVDDMEQEIGVRCLGAPIFDYEGHVIAAISISGPSARLSPDTDATNGAYVAEIAQRISERMGHPVAEREE